MIENNRFVGSDKLDKKESEFGLPPLCEMVRSSIKGIKNGLRTSLNWILETAYMLPGEEEILKRKSQR